MKKKADILVDLELLAAFKAGDTAAFSRLYTIFKHEIYIASWRILKNDVEAEDVTVKTFTTLWQERERMSDASHVRNWLYMTSRNACLDILRHNAVKQKVFSIVTETMEQAVHPHDRITADLISQVWQRAEDMPPRMREVFILRYWAEKPAEEVAQMMKISIDTVYYHSKEALKFIRNSFAENKTEFSILVLLLSLSVS